jgi:molecular chaperone HscC
MKNEDVIVGIDLGTTYSLVAFMQAGRPVVLPNALGESLTPSAVSVGDDGAVLVGDAARARATTHPGRTALAFKRDMGVDRRYELGPLTLRPAELSAMVLGALKRDAEAALGHPITEAVVTVPAYFNDAQRQATRDAASIIGLKVERIINEPTAAALAYGLHQRHRELKAVVIDLGGGTFDVTVLEILEGVIEIQSSAGDVRLGGEDFDTQLAELVAGRVREQHGHDVRGDAVSWARVRAAAEQAKRQLSDEPSAPVALYALPVGGARTVDFETAVTREEAEASWAPLLERLVAPIQRALRDAGLRPEQVGEVLLVGGATRMPCVARLVTQLFGRLPLRTLPPDEAVALGAAVQAALKAGDASVEDMVVTDVAPFTLGLATASRVGNQVVGGIFEPIIERGTVIPCSRTKRFFTTTDFQKQIMVSVYQGEHSLCQENQKLGEYLIANLEPKPAEQCAVDVRFTYDLNGILEVDMSLVNTDRSETLVIESAPGRLRPEELQRAREAMARLKFHPRDALPNATALARADALFVESRGVARTMLGEAIAQMRAALEAQDAQAISFSRERLQALMGSMRR